MRRRDLLIRLGLVAGGLGGAWWVRENILWRKPDATFGPDGSTGWLDFDEPVNSVPTVRVTVGGRSVRALIDSGAQYSVIDRAFFQSLGQGRTFDLPLVAYGVGGQPQLGKGTTLDVTVGALRLSTLRAAILDLGLLASTDGLGTPIILGQDVLSGVVLDIETEARRLRMVDPRRFEMPPGLQAVPVRRSGDAAMTDVTVEGAVIAAVIDTGATALLALSQEAATGAGLLDGRPERSGASIVLGGAIAARIVEARTVTVGDRLYRGVDLPIYADVGLPGFPGALLGMEAFQGQRLILNTGAGTVHVSPAVPTPDVVNAR
mgnify:CR=1 FL=1